VPSTPANRAPFSRRGEARRKAVPGDARRHNRALVPRTMFRHGLLSRADLARETNLTRVTTRAGALGAAVHAARLDAWRDSAQAAAVEPPPGVGVASDTP
jgi:hypothetical protein